ncbi:MAG: PEP-CTERM sorting domain-containing protein [Betaproteobacteria bacterium]|nr:MAG: PEP-CTERM sorting domain-containing protein [Betaproteobacteria bacterium]
MRITHVVTALSLLLVPVLGLAISQVDDVTRIPEPETLVLLAAGGIAWAIARWTKRK